MNFVVSQKRYYCIVIRRVSNSKLPPYTNVWMDNQSLDTFLLHLGSLQLQHMYCELVTAPFIKQYLVLIPRCVLRNEFKNDINGVAHFPSASSIQVMFIHLSIP